MSERVDVQVVITGPIRYTPPPPEQLAAYLEYLRTVDGGAYWPRHLEREGKLTKEQADAAVREARTCRRLQASKIRRRA